MKDGVNFCYYAVASIDVLGMTEACKGLEELPTDEESKARFIEAFKQSAHWIDTFRDCFTELFNAFVEDKESTAKVPEEKKGKFDELRKTILRYRFFSDTIYAFVPLETTGFHANVINGIYGILGACGGMLLGSIAEGKPFRAGIDIAVGTELKYGDLFGPAVIRAYELEQKIAGYPRIVIGDTLLDYLGHLVRKDDPTIGLDEDDKEVCKIMADCCLRMIGIDVDGHRIVDYLGEEFRSKLYKSPEKGGGISFDEIFKIARIFVESEYKRKWIAKDKLATRYFLLNRYFKSKEKPVV
jgi:hypothetical protein